MSQMALPFNEPVIVFGVSACQCCGYSFQHMGEAVRSGFRITEQERRHFVLCWNCRERIWELRAKLRAEDEVKPNDN